LSAVATGKIILHFERRAAVPLAVPKTTTIFAVG